MRLLRRYRWRRRIRRRRRQRPWWLHLRFDRRGGTFGGHGSELNGGGGAGLGGAIFGHSSTITVSNSTFTGNFAVRGVAGTSGFEEDKAAMNGSDAGGAIFTVGGALTITNSTIAGNESTGDGAGVVTYKPE